MMPYDFMYQNGLVINSFWCFEETISYSKLSQKQIEFLSNKPGLDFEEIPFFLQGYRRMFFTDIRPIITGIGPNAIVKDIRDVYTSLLDAAFEGKIRGRDEEHILARSSHSKIATRKGQKEIKKLLVEEFYQEGKTCYFPFDMKMPAILRFASEQGMVMNEHLQTILGIFQSSPRALSKSEITRLRWQAKGQAWMYLNPGRKDKGKIVAEIASDSTFFPLLKNKEALINRKKDVSEVLAKIDSHSKKTNSNEPIPIPGIVKNGRFDLAKVMVICMQFCETLLKEKKCVKQLIEGPLLECYVGKTPHPLVKLLLSEELFFFMTAV
jgi:hypothetical protein